MLFRWKPEYSVGERRIDQEHQTLFELANQVFSICDPTEELEPFKAAVKELCRYTEYHFRHEEELMAGIGFADIDYHKAQHQYLTGAITKLLTTCTTLPDLSSRLQNLLANWLVKHVVEQDRKIGAALQRARQTAAG